MKNHIRSVDSPAGASARLRLVPRMVIHRARTRPGIFGGTLTTTDCGRMNRMSEDGMNSTGDDSKVTCKFCLKQMAARKARHDRERAAADQSR